MDKICHTCCSITAGEGKNTLKIAVTNDLKRLNNRLKGKVSPKTLSGNETFNLNWFLTSKNAVDLLSNVGCEVGGRAAGQYKKT